MDVSFRAAFDPSPDGSKLTPLMAVFHDSGSLMLLVEGLCIDGKADEWRRVGALIERALERLQAEPGPRDLVFEEDGAYFEPTRAQLAVVK